MRRCFRLKLVTPRKCYGVGVGKRKNEEIAAIDSGYFPELRFLLYSKERLIIGNRRVATLLEPGKHR